MTIHANGGGTVQDQAEARPTAYIDADSHINDRARIHSGRVIASTIGLDCRVTDNARIVRSVVSCDHIAGATIIECGLFDQFCAWDSAVLYRVNGSGGARVYGSAKVLGINGVIRLWGDMRVCMATLHRSPRYLHLGFCFLTESGPGWAAVDCKFAPYDRWFRIGARYARRQYGWQPEQLDQVREVFKEWQASENFQGKHWGPCVLGCVPADPDVLI